MTDINKWLKHNYSFSDFLFYTMALSVPLITAMVSISGKSIAALVVFMLLLVVSIPVVLRFFCSHCPHYCRDEKTLKCIFFWGLPKFFKQRPGPLSTMEKVCSIMGPALVILYPIYWLFQEPGLLLVYVLSIVVFGASIRRNECAHCIYTDCPANTANQYPED